MYRHGNGVAAEQPALLVTLDDRLEKDHFVRKLLALTSEVLGEELRSQTGLRGGFSYDPVNLLAVWLFAFMQGERSSRRVEELCRYDLRYEYLAGSCKPDYSTLSRFRCSLGENLEMLMAKVCAKAEADGFLKRRAMAVDGTKIAARVSQWKKAREESEVEDATLEEAVTMVSHGHYLVGYNVQVSADMDSMMVMGYVVSDKPEDSTQMPDVLPAVQRQSGGLSEKVVTDRGFGSSVNAVAVKEAGIEGFLPSKERGQVVPFKKGEDGVFRCAAGHVPKESQWIDKKYGEKVYLQLRVSHCRTCPLAGECPGKNRQRTMKILISDENDEKHACVARCRTPEGRELLRNRGSTIERVFAILKARFGFRRFLLCGKQKAATEFGLAILAYNLQRLRRVLLQLQTRRVRLFYHDSGRSSSRLSPWLSNSSSQTARTTST
jgi:transposase